ncbi:hypothetical protein C8Q79DRAFT_653977 [Trametes meyenii]|nr:hypothetical protein C8Q79DRAFT_653977 [Trametes meyenii]
MHVRSPSVTRLLRVGPALGMPLPWACTASSERVRGTARAPPASLRVLGAGEAVPTAAANGTRRGRPLARARRRRRSPGSCPRFCLDPPRAPVTALCGSSFSSTRRSLQRYTVVNDAIFTSWPGSAVRISVASPSVLSRLPTYTLFPSQHRRSQHKQVRRAIDKSGDSGWTWLAAGSGLNLETGNEDDRTARIRHRQQLQATTNSIDTFLLSVLQVGYARLVQRWPNLRARATYNDYSMIVTKR